MIVRTSAPIIEESSNASGKRKKRVKGDFGKRATEKFKGGYAKVKESGALPVIENLLGLGKTPETVVTDTTLPTKETEQKDTTPTGMSTTKKVVIGVVILGAIIGGYLLYKKNVSSK